MRSGASCPRRGSSARARGARSPCCWCRRRAPVPPASAPARRAALGPPAPALPAVRAGGPCHDAGGRFGTLLLTQVTRWARQTRRRASDVLWLHLGPEARARRARGIARDALPVHLERAHIEEEGTALRCGR